MEATKKMEFEAINAAEAGRLRDALDILNQALLIAPKRASLYNNRAQVHQLLKNYDGKILSSGHVASTILRIILFRCIE